MEGWRSGFFLDLFQIGHTGLGGRFGIGETDPRGGDARLPVVVLRWLRMNKNNRNVLQMRRKSTIFVLLLHTLIYIFL